MDWNAIATIIASIITAYLAFILDKYLHNKPRVIAYYLHASVHTVKTEQPGIIHTHAIVIRNSGRIAAKNIRVGHAVFPSASYSVNPPTEHEVRVIDENKSTELLFPILVPGEQITISYLYFPPVTFKDINTYIKSDEGFAKILNVIPTPQLPKWLANIMYALIFIGGLVVVYLTILLIFFLFKHTPQLFCS